jgi:hypothetical protein
MAKKQKKIWADIIYIFLPALKPLAVVFSKIP